MSTHSKDPDSLEYKREFYRLQHEFFKRGKEPAGECLDPEHCGVNSILCDNCHEWAGWEIRGENYRYLAENPDKDTSVPADDPANMRKFTIQVNIRSDGHDIETEIDRQVKAIKQKISEERRFRHGLLRDRLKGKGGKSLPTGGKDTFRYWRRCLDAYDLRQGGVSWEQIGQKHDDGYKAGSPFGKIGGIKPKGSYTSAARDDYKEAERLINSALNGTFPD